MASQLISFRLTETEIEALKERAVGDESLNLIAQRLLRENLGVSTGESTPVDIKQLIASELAPIQEKVAQLELALQGK